MSDATRLRAVMVHNEDAPTASIVIPTGQQLVVCLDCSDEIRTSYVELAGMFRMWHQHKHVDGSQ